MTERLRSCGKEVLLDGRHFVDCANERTAAAIARVMGTVVMVRDGGRANYNPKIVLDNLLEAVADL